MQPRLTETCCKRPSWDSNLGLPFPESGPLRGRDYGHTAQEDTAPECGQLRYRILQRPFWVIHVKEGVLGTLTNVFHLHRDQLLHACQGTITKLGVVSVEASRSLWSQEARNLEKKTDRSKPVTEPRQVVKNVVKETKGPWGEKMMEWTKFRSGGQERFLQEGDGQAESTRNVERQAKSFRKNNPNWSNCMSEGPEERWRTGISSKGEQGR